MKITYILLFAGVVGLMSCNSPSNETSERADQEEDVVIGEKDEGVMGDIKDAGKDVGEAVEGAAEDVGDAVKGDTPAEERAEDREEARKDAEEEAEEKAEDEAEGDQKP